MLRSAKLALLTTFKPMNYSTITKITYLGSTDTINITEYKDIVKNSYIANKTLINRIIKKHLPSIYEQLNLDSYNPYPYKRNENYLIANVAGKEHFFSYSIK